MFRIHWFNVVTTYVSFGQHWADIVPTLYVHWNAENQQELSRNSHPMEPLSGAVTSKHT